MKMNKMQFICTLLSDVILSQNAGSKENQSTLDYIPGNVFLGIAASGSYSKLSAAESMTLFHSGKVCFGDAHPLFNDCRSLRIPAILYYKKGEKLEENGAYVMHKWEPGDAQPKQCRDGFYAFASNDRCYKVEPKKSVAIKSAYDRTERRSKDKAMYAYESLGKGMKFAFEVEYDESVNTRLVGLLKQALVGKRHAGHSKTSQYGLINIEDTEFATVSSRSCITSGSAVVYADSRLIFIDECGMPKFCPTALDLGFEAEAVIDWTKSQIRTFRFAPWNAKRQVRDTDRCGVEKGSVFVVDLKGTESPSESRYVGCYNNEGFGKVIYNPAFLESKEDGKSLLEFCEVQKGQSCGSACEISQKSLNKLLYKRLESISGNVSDVYDKVNGFVEENKMDFRKGEERFASQWGYIRSLAETCSDVDKLKNALKEYLDHGVAADKWKYKRKNLDAFVDTLNENNWRDAMVNLAAEMAKQCNK